MVRPLLLAVTAITALSSALLGAPAAAQAAAVVTTVATGHDVSYPQCGTALPERQDIAVVGVNAGTGTTTNPCLAQQLAWGDGLRTDSAATDGTARTADVYVNTADPGHLGGWWPSGDRTRGGAAVQNTQGSCVGAENAACAYVYGYSIALDDARTRGVTNASQRTWWLDVETTNTWSWDRSANRAVLEGMTDALQGLGARVGLYSTTRQWSLIAGQVDAASPLAGLPTWLSGAVTRGGAEANCSTGALTPGGTVAMTQWVTAQLDHDVSCSTGVSGTRPSVGGLAVPGAVLVAAARSWGPDGVVVTYQWLRNGVPVPGAVRSTLTPTAADVGARISVRMTGTRAGAPALTLTSGTVTVARPAAATASPTPTSTPAPTPSAAAPGAQASPTPNTSTPAPSTPDASAPGAPVPSSPAPSSPAPSAPTPSAAPTASPAPETLLAA